MKRLQAVFINLLAETNGTDCVSSPPPFPCMHNILVDSRILFFSEITQEVAARGLGLTYELCDSSMKQEMVQSLVGTLMEGRRCEEEI